MELLRVVLILFLAAAVPFTRQLLFGAGLLDDDVFLQSLPAWEWLSRTLRSGDSILWAPEIMGGFPIAFTQYPFLYPPDLLLARVLPPLQAYAWSLVLHLFLAGLLTYLYCRTAGLGLGAALLAALSFQLSTEVVAGSSGFAAHSAFALPGGFLAVELLLRRGWRYGPLLSLVIAAALLGGHPQLVLLGLGAGAAYAVFRLALVARSAGIRVAGTLAGWLALSAAVGVAGAAVRLLPTWEVVALSTRAGGLPEGAGGSGPLSLQGLIVGYLLPLSRLETLPWGSPGYAGPAVVVLAVLGLPRLLGHSLGRFFLGLAVLAAVLSLGDATPLHGITRLPLLLFFREPSRFSLLTTYSLALLGAMVLNSLGGSSGSLASGKASRVAALAVLSGLVATVLFVLGGLFQFGSGPEVESLRVWSESHFVDLLNPLRPRMALAILGVPAVALMLALAARGKLSRSQLEGLLVITTMAVLVPVAAILNPPIEAEVMGKPPETVRFLEGQREQHRVFSHRPGMRLYNHRHFYGPGPEAGFADDLRYRFQAEMLAPVLNLRWGIPSADGYEQLHSRYQELLLRYLDSERISDWAPAPGKWAHLTMEHRLRVLRMLNGRYLLSGVDLAAEAPALRPVAQVSVEPGPVSRGAPSIYVLEIPDPLPRYYLVSQVRTFSSDAEALDAVALGEVDPGTTLLLAGEVSSAPGSEVGRSFGSPQGSVQLLSSRNTEVSLSVSSDRPAYLVTSDSYWPGWRAFVDGREVPVHRANVGGRAVWLSEGGTHLVTFRYEPPALAWGAVFSVAAGLAALGWSALATLRGRSRENTTSTMV